MYITKTLEQLDELLSIQNKSWKNFKLCYIDSIPELISTEDIYGNFQQIDNPMKSLGYSHIVYFAEVDDLSLVRGDDWNDAPYEHNSGEPYDELLESGIVISSSAKWKEILVIKVLVKLNSKRSTFEFVLPKDRSLSNKLSYSVLDINSSIDSTKPIPWLEFIDTKNITRLKIHPGTTLVKFIELYKTIKF